MVVGFWMISGLRTFRIAHTPLETERVAMLDTIPTPKSFIPPTTTAQTLVNMSKFSPGRALWKALSGSNSRKPLKPSRAPIPVA